MIRISVKDLEGKKVLGYNIYTDGGKLVYPKGTELTAGKILQLSYIKIYKNPLEVESEEDSEVESLMEAEKEIHNSDLIFTEIPDEPSYSDSRISPAVRVQVLQSTRHFLEDITTGKTPDIAMCEIVSDKLVEEVASKIDDIEYLGQLRMFDEYTYSHNVNVSALSIALGMKVGVKERDIKDLALSTLLHDIGKMRIPKEILNKPGRLTDKEFEIMKLHTVLGFKVIKDELSLPFKISRVALEHQERFTGTGYPKGLKYEEIGMFSQICAIADVYDALVSKRVYKPARTSQEAIKIMLSEGSKSFNPGYLYKFTHMANYSQQNVVMES